MFGQDSVKKQVRQLGNALAMILFHKPLDTQSAYSMESLDKQAHASELLRKIDSGKIREAEADLLDSIGSKTMDDLLTGITFYEHLADKSESFLDDHAYNSVDLKLGARRFADRLGGAEIARLFFT